MCASPLSEGKNVNLKHKPRQRDVIGVQRIRILELLLKSSRKEIFYTEIEFYFLLVGWKTRDNEEES